MQIDLTKIFPQSCAKKGIEKFVVNYDDIGPYYRETKTTIGFAGRPTSEDVVYLGKGLGVHRFSPEDNGLETLAVIGKAVSVANAWAAAKETLIEGSCERLDFEKRKNAATSLLTAYILDNKVPIVQTAQSVDAATTVTVPDHFAMD